MNLIEDAVIFEIFGIRMYAYGTYVALGALCSLITLFAMSRTYSMKKGTAPLAFLLSSISGIICSRICFCLMNQELGKIMPLYSWPQITGGGWSMFGLIGGVFLGGWICSRITGQKTGSIMDILSLSVLPLIIAERIGENRIEDFNISRTLQNEVIAKSFLAIGEEYNRCLMTYYVCAAVCLILFAVLLVSSRHMEDGCLAVSFLLLFGAASIILESLRYDFFLSVSFVRLQQIAAAVMLAIGIILAIRHTNRPKSGLAVASLICFTFMIAVVIGLEFALDRTTWNKIMIYGFMILTVCIPAILGLKMLKSNR